MSAILAKTNSNQGASMNILERRMAQNAQHQESAFRANRLASPASQTLFKQGESVTEIFTRLLSKDRIPNATEACAEPTKQEQ